MFDYGEDARRHKPGRAYHIAGAGQLTDLDGRARAAHLDAAARALGFDDVFPRRAIARVDEDLDKISLCHRA